jgi:hypothetical protein
MAIYRGPGGPGDATADSANTAQVAEAFATQAGASAVAAAGSAVDANDAKVAAQTAAELAETNAETAQAAAEAAQLAAETAQTAAELAETNAETAETGALAAQAAAESARDSALAAYDNFDDRYLGAKTSDPTLDNDGDALVAGALYFNSVAGEMRLYTGSIWVAAYVSGAGFLAVANNLSDLASAATARQNLDLEIGVDVQAYDATILKSADIGVTVQAYDADTVKYDDVNPSFTDTGAIKVPVGTEAQRPASPVAGQLRFNDDADEFEGYNGTEWGAIGGGGGGGSGDVVGPASATDNAVARFDGTTGKLIQNSAVTIADTSGDITTSGVVLASDGSASNPSFAFSGDPDTGIYKSFTNTLAFASGGVVAGEFDGNRDFKFNSGYGSVFYSYGCRAWVSFNGTGTPSIRGSGNVSSITDHSAGQYTLNFTFTLVDGNYGFFGTGVRSASETQNRIVCADARTSTGNISSGSVRIINQGASSGTPVDNDYIFACIFR